MSDIAFLREAAILAFLLIFKKACHDTADLIANFKNGKIYSSVIFVLVYMTGIIVVLKILQPSVFTFMIFFFVGLAIRPKLPKENPK